MNKTLLFAAASTIILSSCGNKTITEESHAEHKHSAFELSNLDSNAHACEDFYQFAIGGWIKENPVPSTESRWAVFNVLKNENETKLQTILDEIITKEHKKGTDAQLISDLYKSANDSLAREEEGMTALKPFLAQANKVASLENFTSLIPTWSTLGATTPFGFYVSADGKKSSDNAAYMGQSGLSLPDKEYYLSEEEKYTTIRTKFVDHIAKVYDILGLENGQENAENVLAFETEIAKISWDRTKNRNPNLTYNKMGVDDFDDRGSNLPVREMLNSYGIKGIDSIIVSQPTYFTELNSMLANMDVNKIKSYLNWGLIDAYASF